MVRRVFLTALAVSCMITTAGYIAVLLKGASFLRLFAVDIHMIHTGTRLMKLIMACLPFIGLQVLGSAYFQAAGKGKEASFLTLWRQFLVLIPLLLILPRFLGLDGICFAFITADGTSILLAAYMLSREKPLRGAKSDRSEEHTLTEAVTPA